MTVVNCVVLSGFMRKVYGLLAVQLSITTLIGAVFLFTPGVKEFVQVSNHRIQDPLSIFNSIVKILLQGQTLVSVPCVSSLNWTSDRTPHQEEGNSH